MKQSFLLSRHNAKLSFVCVSFAVILPACPAYSQEANDTQTHRFSVGVGAFASTNPFEGGDEIESGIFPFFQYEGDKFSVGPEGVSYKAVRQGAFGMDLYIAPRWVIVDPSETERLTGIDRETGADLGVRFGGQIGRVSGDVSFQHDISDKSDGQEINARVGVEIMSSRYMTLGAESGVSWKDSKLLTYQYGVLPKDVNSNFAPFELDDQLTPYLGVMLNVQISEKTSVVIAARGEILPDDVKDSPIVERDNVIESFTALVYTF